MNNNNVINFNNSNSNSNQSQNQHEHICEHCLDKQDAINDFLEEFHELTSDLDGFDGKYFIEMLVSLYEDAYLSGKRNIADNITDFAYAVAYGDDDSEG